MRSPWSDAENAAWAWLEGDPAFVNLKLKPYRASDGNPPPFDPQQRFWTCDELPCIATERTFRGESEQDAVGRSDQFKLKFRVAFKTSTERGPGASRLPIENAAAIILDRLTSDEAIRTCLGAPDDVEEVAMGPYTFIGWPKDANTRGEISVWEWTAELIITLPTRSH